MVTDLGVADPNNPSKMIPGDTNCSMIFIWPGVLTVLFAIAFLLTFRDPAPEAEDMVTQTTPSTVPPIAAEET